MEKSTPKRYYGVYRGTVVSNADPLNSRRLRLKVPQVFADQTTDWAWCKDSSTTHFTTPAIGQGVWVMFEGGDPSFPIWTGSFGKYSGKGKQVEVTDLPSGSYPSTVKMHGKDFDLIATIIAIAKTLEDVRLSLNAHGGGDGEAPPADVSNH